MRLAAILTLLVLPLVANAQVYTWKDAKGKVHYSDQPPPDQGVSSRRLARDATTVNEVPAATQALADKRQDAAKQAAEAKEKAAKTEKERAEDAQRQQACERSRINLQGLESGQIRFRMTASGEREALDGSVRDAELAEARRTVDTNCSPRPTAGKK
jgi:hypothetical protein